MESRQGTMLPEPGNEIKHEILTKVIAFGARSPHPCSITSLRCFVCRQIAKAFTGTFGVGGFVSPRVQGETS